MEKKTIQYQILTVCITSMWTLIHSRILGSCLLIPSLPGKALRMLVESRGLPRDSICVLDAEPGKLDIKRCEPGILFISLQVASL